MGTAIGVVVIPKGFAPDGKVRIIGLNAVDKDGNQSGSYVYMNWGRYNIDTSLTNYTKVPTTDNAGSTSTGSNEYGDLPSDKFTGTTSFVDPKANYDTDVNIMIPSPYLGDSPNPEYYKTISGNNALSDFNGLGNTETLVGLGSKYEAANAAWKYNDSLSGLKWYLPGMGELGYIMPRFNEINNTLTALGGLTIETLYRFWSSSEIDKYSAYYMYASGQIRTALKDEGYYVYVRPFAILD